MLITANEVLKESIDELIEMVRKLNTSIDEALAVETSDFNAAVLMDAKARNHLFIDSLSEAKESLDSAQI